MALSGYSNLCLSLWTIITSVRVVAHSGSGDIINSKLISKAVDIADVSAIIFRDNTPVITYHAHL